MAILFVDDDGGVFRADMKSGATTRLASYSHDWTDIAVLPDGRVFATTFNGLYELNLSTQTAILRKSLNGSANALAADSAGNLYVGSANASIQVISGKNFSNLSSIGLPSGVSSAGDIHINGNTLYYSSASEEILTVNLTSKAVTHRVLHGIEDLFGIHSENGMLYGMAGNELFQLNAKTGETIFLLELPVNLKINGSATLKGVRVEGTSGADVLLADANGSTIVGFGGDDILIGSDVVDRLYGGAGEDNIHGAGGADLLSGDAQDDVLLGGTGNDTLKGGSHNDVLKGGQHNDMLYGGTGDDTLDGGAGLDSLWGGDGDDILRGASGNDVLRGDGGRDFLSGGSGNDILIGGAGADDFIFLKGGGTDQIRDFQNNVDTLQIDLDLITRGPKTVAGLLANYATETAGGVVFDFGANGKFTVQNIADEDVLLNDIILI